MTKYLEIILNELKRNIHFSNEYDITIHKTLCTSKVRIMRKETPIEEKYTYSPYISTDYTRWGDFGFDIYYYTDYYFYHYLKIIPVKILKNDEYKFGRRIIKAPHYEKKLLFNKIDFQDVIKYIKNTEYNFIFVGDNETNFLPFE
jgi:hypothetical protein